MSEVNGMKTFVKINHEIKQFLDGRWHLLPGCDELWLWVF